MRSGADTEKADITGGRTPLMTAAAYGDMDVLELLIQAGACLDKRDNNRRTAADILKAEFVAMLACLLAPSFLCTDVRRDHAVATTDMQVR